LPFPPPRVHPAWVMSNLEHLDALPRRLVNTGLETYWIDVY
jgi:hypothetical protein